MTAKALLERDVQKAIVQAFRLQHRVHLFTTDAGNARARAEAGRAGLEGFRGTSGLPTGFPDLIGAIPGNGRMVVIEVKRPGNIPTENQQHYLAVFKAAGAVAFWADSVEAALRQFEEALNGRAA